MKNVLKVTFLANVLTSMRLFHLSDKRLGIIALLVEYRFQQIFYVESGIQGFETLNTAQGIGNSNKDWNPKSNFH